VQPSLSTRSSKKDVKDMAETSGKIFVYTFAGAASLSVFVKKVNNLHVGVWNKEGRILRYFGDIAVRTRETVPQCDLILNSILVFS
jgi:hypothetical protein